MVEGGPSWQQFWADNSELNLAAVWEVNAAQRVRVALNYGGTWRPIFWVEFGKDGSIYLGPRYEKLSYVRKGSKSGERSVTIWYDEGDPVPVEETKGARVTFHPSGAVNLGDERLWQPPFRDLSDQVHLCGLLFEHPTAFAPLAEVRKRDICLPYPIDERRPLVGDAYVAPKGQAVIVRRPQVERQANLVIECAGLTGIGDLAFQLMLSHGPEGPWPPYSYVYVGVPAERPTG